MTTRLLAIIWSLSLAGALLSRPSLAVELCKDHKKWDDCNIALQSSSSSTPKPKACEGIADFLLKESSSGPEFSLSAANQLNEAEIHESRASYSAIVTKSKLIQLTQVADSRVVDAELGRKANVLDRKDFESPLMQEKIASLYTKSMNGVTLQALQALVMQVQPSEPLPLGEKELPGSGPVVMDRDHNCVRPALPNDWKPNSSGYLPILSYPPGFAEIGLSISRRGGESRPCGFVLIDPEWAVTALHCVAQSIDKKAVVDAFEIVDEMPRTVFLLPDLTQSQENVLDCLSPQSLSSCPARILKVLDIQFADDAWPHPGEVPTVDLALLRLDPTTTKGLRFIQPNFQALTPEAVTVAGFGDSNTENHEAGFGLLVGWHKNGKPDIQGRVYEWSRMGDPNGTIQCTGDSGSAVYIGQFFGREEEFSSKKLYAIMSAIVHDKGLTGISRCTKADSTRSVIIAGYKTWLCNKIPRLSGCSA